VSRNGQPCRGINQIASQLPFDRKMSPPDPLRSKLRNLPTRPGVYLMKGADGEVLYVGKAKSLRPRVRSYFAGAAPSLKTRELVRRVSDVDTIVVGSEAEALILENNLIKEHQPRFNISLRDDKTYPYIKVSVQEAFPRVIVTRRLQRDGARYFGPYTDVRRMRQALEVVKRLHTVRSCHYRLPDEAPARPCLDFHIGRCLAPCVALQSEEEYRRMIDEILDILSGHTRRAAERIRKDMAQAAAELRFERAAELRDALGQLELLEARQQVVDVEGNDRDVVALARDGDEACGVVLRIREGKLLGREVLFLANLADEPDEVVLGTFATRFYAGGGEGVVADIPPEVFFPWDFQDRPILEAVLGDRALGAVRTRVPQRGAKVRLIELAEQNARHLLEERRLLGSRARESAPDALYDLQDVLELSRVPRRIACFDVSHTQGSETVASAVLFENGRPHKGGYRRFKIRGEWGNDDFRSMAEAVSRYVKREVEEGRSLPDLIVIDGGKGQLGAARRSLEEIEAAHVPVISLAKREEEVFVPGRSEPLRLARRSLALRLLQQLRNEAHRFAVGYNRSLRSKRTIRSELGEIPGIGPTRQRRLLEHFGSVRALRRATEEEVARVPGFSERLARVILAHVRGAEGGATTTGERIE
jgi:excinuclease ABC subunit C